MSYLLLINKVDKSYKKNFQELFMFHSFIKFNLKFIYQVDFHYMYIYQINMLQVVNVQMRLIVNFHWPKLICKDFQFENDSYGRNVRIPTMEKKSFYSIWEVGMPIMCLDSFATIEILCDSIHHQLKIHKCNLHQQDNGKIHEPFLIQGVSLCMDSFWCFETNPWNPPMNLLHEDLQLYLALMICKTSSIKVVITTNHNCQPNLMHFRSQHVMWLETYS